MPWIITLDVDWPPNEWPYGVLYRFELARIETEGLDDRRRHHLLIKHSRLQLARRTNRYGNGTGTTSDQVRTSIRPKYAESSKVAYDSGL